MDFVQTTFVQTTAAELARRLLRNLVRDPERLPERIQPIEQLAARQAPFDERMEVLAAVAKSLRHHTDRRRPPVVETALLAHLAQGPESRSGS